MNILAMENVSKSYGEKGLLREINFGIEDGEKIGLLGINGSGKSTFLKIIARREEPDLGSIIWNKNLRVHYLPQEPPFEPCANVLDTVLNGDSAALLIYKQYQALTGRSETAFESEDLHQKILHLSQQMEAHDAWALESEAKGFLNKLGIHDFEARMDQLSGGQRKRVALAAALMNPADLLILDEPTNHLDNQAIDWLEGYLQKLRTPLLMVTHDRYFLERVTNRIIEIEGGQLYSYPGSYSRYLELKLQREEIEASAASRKQALLRKELAWMKKGAKARTTKQKARIQRFEDLNKDQPQAKTAVMQISSTASRLGKKIITLHHVSHGFDGKKLINDYSCILDRNERMGLTGPNGIGKSTLLSIMGGDLIPQNGEVEIGPTVKIGYFPQESTGLPDDMRVIDYIREAGEYLQAGKKLLSAAQMLETFLFSPASQWNTIQKLSGGEKRRLHLLRILMGSPNVLLLDEPGNNLDIDTLTILEDYLDDFPGAVAVVSHDRYFLDRVCDSILAFEKEGRLGLFPGNYSDYLLRTSNQDKNFEGSNNHEADLQKNAATSASKISKPLKFSFQEQKDFAEIDERIAAVEDELKKIDLQINQSASDYQKLERLLQTKKSIDERLETLFERWAYLNELAEEIEKRKPVR